MVVCFFCNNTLYGERTQVCSSITPRSKVTYQEKILELMGDEFVVIVTPADHMCKKCNTLLTQIDKLENDLKFVKNVLLSFIQKKYCISPLDQANEIVNEHPKEEKQLKQGQRKVPKGLTVGVAPTITTTAVVTPIQTPLKLLKTQQQRQQRHQQKLRQQNIKIYKCSICTFQSKVLDHVQFHMRAHMNKKEPEKSILNQATAKALSPKRETEAEFLMNVNKNQQDNNKYTIDVDMMLNDLPIEGSPNVEQEENKKNTVLLEHKESDKETADSVEKEVGEDNANVENKTGDFDIESMFVLNL